MTLKRSLLIILAVLAFVSANAKTAIWSISPNYQDLQRFSGEMYLCQSNSKWGIIKSGDIIILPANFDFITPFNNGYALAGSKEGSRYLVERIIGIDGKILLVNEKFYISGGNNYFSEEKLAVSNKSGKYGYINPIGEVVVKCQFENALPFKEGFAPVKKGNYMIFINENYDRNASRNTLVVDFHYGEMTAAGCFANGLAPVAYNTDYALINGEGQKVRKIKKDEFIQKYKSNSAAPASAVSSFTSSSSYSDYYENGKYGLKQGNNIVVEPQFDSFGEKYSDGDIIATMSGRKGVLRICDGETSIQFKVNGIQTAEIDADRQGNIKPVSLFCDVPDNLANYRILLDDGSGTLTDKTTRFIRSGNSYTYSTVPSVSKNANGCDIRVVIEQKGIVLADKTQHFTINYPTRLRVTSPGPSKVRANENKRAIVSSTIFNDSNKPVSVTATWSNGDSLSVHIPAHSSKSVSTAFVVTKNTTKDVSIKLSSGERAHSNITFTTYF